MQIRMPRSGRWVRLFIGILLFKALIVLFIKPVFLRNGGNGAVGFHLGEGVVQLFHHGSVCILGKAHADLRNEQRFVQIAVELGRGGTLPAPSRSGGKSCLPRWA